MKHLLFFILLVAFSSQLSAISSQLSAISSQRTSCTVPEPVEGTTLGASTSSATAYPRTVDCCPLSVDYYENQIRLADSLYKNYLPQYNFDEVKTAMKFFDSLRLSKTTDNSQRTTDFVHWWTTDNGQQTTDIFHRSKTKSCTSDAYPRTVDCCPLTVDFICAKAHYYHAVGLTERDDIVGACEHYLTALEIMESETENLKTSKSEKGREQRAMSHEQKFRNAHSSKLEAQSPDYEKIRFIALTYTRLGRLFYDENYCDLAMLKYKKALKYYNIIDDTISISYTYKNIGNVYQLLDKTDSALYHYRKSLEIYSGMTNKLDIEKSIAQILFNKGERDSAYTLIKNNLDKIENYGSKYSYYATLGNMYYVDKKYDSAIFYFNKEFVSQDIVTNNFVYTKLSAIYDSLGFYEMKTYYDNIRSELSIITINKDVSNNKLQNIYEEYKERKTEKEKLENKKKTNLIVSVLIGLISLTIVFTILIWHKSKRKDRIHQESLNEKDRYIANKEEVISRTNEEIKRKESEIKELVEIIGNLKSDINSLKDDAAIKEQEISCKETDIKKMENDLSAKERELKRLQENVHENRILIDRLNEDNIAKEKQIECYIEEIDDNRQVINDKNHLISIATEGLVARKDAIAENRNEIARLQAIIGKNEKFLNKLSEDYRNNKEQMAVYLDEIEKLKTEINQAQIDIKDLRFKNSFTEGKIKKQNAELKNKEELIGRYTTEISELKNKLDIIDSDNNNDNTHIPKAGMELYLQSKVCSKILNEINELSAGNIDTNRLTPLRHEEFVVLLNAARLYLNNFNEIAVKHSQLKTYDLYYICLVILGLNDIQISSLFSMTYNAIKKRRKKICSVLMIEENELKFFPMNIY